MSETQPLRVVIADETPVVRHLMRFFLEEEGFQVQGETARGDELIDLVRKHRPDAVVLNERLAGVDGLFAVPRIRTASPTTRIAMCTPSPGEQPLAGGTRGADVYLEEGVGLKDLAFVLRSLCDAPYIAPAAVEDVVHLPESEVVSSASAREPVDVSAWWSRFVAAAAVALTVLAFGLALPPVQDPSTVPPPSAGLAPSPEALEALELAEFQLVALVDAIDQGVSEQRVTKLAEQLLAARGAAIEAGADVSRLDAMIGSELGSKLSGLSPSMAFALRTVLGPLIPPGGGAGSGVGSPRDPGNPGARGGPVAGGARGTPPGLSGDTPVGPPEGKGGGKQEDGGKNDGGKKDGGKKDDGSGGDGSGGDSGDGSGGNDGSGGDSGGDDGSDGDSGGSDKPGGGKGKGKDEDGVEQPGTEPTPGGGAGKEKGKGKAKGHDKEHRGNGKAKGHDK